MKEKIVKLNYNSSVLHEFFFVSLNFIYFTEKTREVIFHNHLCMSDYHIQAHFEPKRKVYMKWILKNSLFYYESFQNFKSNLF